jgi:hypothetical protein
MVIGVHLDGSRSKCVASSGYGAVRDRDGFRGSTQARFSSRTSSGLWSFVQQRDSTSCRQISQSRTRKTTRVVPLCDGLLITPVALEVVVGREAAIAEDCAAVIGQRRRVCLLCRWWGFGLAPLLTVQG